MSDDQFYPTPPELVEKMISSLSVRGIYGRYILDPSAGNGAILDYLLGERFLLKGGHRRRLHSRARAEHMSCIEIDPERQLILQGKGYRLIGKDFLDYDDVYTFDLILMNPPFSAGVKHLMKAWEIVAAGGDVICLLNAETISNPYTAERRVLAELIKAHGSVEDAGRPFVDAMVKTAVEVVIVRLQKPKTDFAADFGSAQYERDFRQTDEAFTANPLAHVDIIKSLVTQYETARAILAQQQYLARQYYFTITDSIENRLKAVQSGADYTRPISSSFFEIRIFKKGTVHLTFVDDELLDLFNLRANEAIGARVGDGE